MNLSRRRLVLPAHLCCPGHPLLPDDTGQAGPVTGAGGGGQDPGQEPTGQDPGQQGAPTGALRDAPLGEQLEFHKSKARREEQARKDAIARAEAAEAEAEKLRRDKMTEDQKANADAIKSAEARVRADMGSQLVALTIKAEAAGRIPEATLAALLAGIDPDKFTDSTGAPDPAAITALVTAMVPATGAAGEGAGAGSGGTGAPDLGQGRGRSAPTGATGLKAAADRYATQFPPKTPENRSWPWT